MSVILIDTDKLVKQGGYANQDIKIIRDNCQATGEQIDNAKFFIPAARVESILRTSNMHLAQMTKKGLFPGRIGTAGYKGYDGREILKFLWESIHGYNVDLRIKKQREIQLQIQNRAALSKYVSREIAEERHRTLLAALQRMFQYIIKTAAPMMVGVSSPRMAEGVLRERFKDIFGVLENESQKIEWKDEQGVDDPDAELERYEVPEEDLEDGESPEDPGPEIPKRKALAKRAKRSRSTRSGKSG